jgi:hypothetical protein
MPLYESMIPQDRRGPVAALIRAAAGSCSARKRFYEYAAVHGMEAACDYVAIQPGAVPEGVRALRDEVDDVVAELRLPPPNPTATATATATGGS